MNHILHTAGLIFPKTRYFNQFVHNVVQSPYTKQTYKLQLFEQKPCLIVFSQICQVVHIASMNQC